MGRRAVASPEQSTVLLQDAAVLTAETLDADYFSIVEISPRDGSLAMLLTNVKDEDGQSHLTTTAIDRADASCLTAHSLAAEYRQSDQLRQTILSISTESRRSRRRRVAETGGFQGGVLQRHFRGRILLPSREYTNVRYACGGPGDLPECHSCDRAGRPRHAGRARWKMHVSGRMQLHRADEILTGLPPLGELLATFRRGGDFFVAARRFGEYNGVGAAGKPTPSLRASKPTFVMTVCIVVG